MRGRCRCRVPRRLRIPPSAFIASAQHRGGDAQLACDPAQRPTAAHQQGYRFPLELIRKLTPSLAHSTPFRSRRSLAKVPTNSREPHELYRAKKAGCRRRGARLIPPASGCSSIIAVRRSIWFPARSSPASQHSGDGRCPARNRARPATARSCGGDRRSPCASSTAGALVQKPYAPGCRSRWWRSDAAKKRLLRAPSPARNDRR
jgi:hypothetical protein